ncbi:hypothetical protein [Psychromonas ingrahamii]|nr:hypothetical protein [Psychromonas ingrahamii]
MEKKIQNNKLGLNYKSEIEAVESALRNLFFAVVDDTEEKSGPTEKKRMYLSHLDMMYNELNNIKKIAANKDLTARKYFRPSGLAGAGLYYPSVDQLHEEIEELVKYNRKVVKRNGGVEDFAKSLIDMRSVDKKNLFKVKQSKINGGEKSKYEEHEGEIKEVLDFYRASAKDDIKKGQLPDLIAKKIDSKNLKNGTITNSTPPSHSSVKNWLEKYKNSEYKYIFKKDVAASLS